MENNIFIIKQRVKLHIFYQIASSYRIFFTEMTENKVLSCWKQKQIIS